ncbi:MAG: response regulator [Chloroflexi bacterium]|nr:response regulator [Chloroflexota bacterium]
MNVPLRVLIVDDSELDVQLLLRELRRGGYDPTFRRVDTRESMRAALDEREWDVVVADYVMPCFCGLAALGVLQEKGLDLPFIVVSGEISEEIAVEAMRAGAHDFVCKDKLARLNPAIQRELREVTTRRERKRAQEELRESEARFCRMAENAQDIIYRYELRPRRCFSYVSPSLIRILGYAPEELYADHEFALQLVHAEDRSVVATLLQGQVPPRAITARVRHKSGHTVFLEMRNVAVRDDLGGIAAVEGIARDVTERRQLEESLLRAQRLEVAGLIAAQVAHDFNNLLSPLTAYPQLIKMQLPPDHSCIRLCDTLRKAAEQMAAINDDLLTLGRRGHFSKEPTDLNALVQEAIAHIPELPANVAVKLDLAPGLLPVDGSPAQLSRAIFGLVANGLEAMADGGVVSVQTENVYMDTPDGRFSRVEIGEYVRLTVSDTGCGIPPEIMERIFDPFFTTKRSQKKRGAGLGLSIVQSIVGDHRGHVDVVSEAGKGARFSVYLPVSSMCPRASAGEGLCGGSESILIVDDDEFQREVARELLERLGYHVDVVGSGEEAVGCLINHPADLLVLDMVMPPGIDGLETYRRALEVRPGQRAIVVSGFAERARVEEALTLGAASFVRKPIMLESLARAVREGLDR